MTESWQLVDLTPQFAGSRGVCGVVRMGVGLSHKSNTLQITFSFSGVNVKFLSTKS